MLAAIKESPLEARRGFCMHLSYHLEHIILSSLPVEG